MMQLTWPRLLSVSLLIAALTLETVASRVPHRGANNNRKHHRSVAKDEDFLPSGRFVTQNYWNSLKGQSTNNACEETTETIPVTITLTGDDDRYFDDYEYDYPTTPVRDLQSTTFTEPETKAPTTPAPATSTTPAPTHNPVIIGFYDNYEYDDDDYDSSNDNYNSYSDDVDDNDEGDNDVSKNDDDDLTVVNSKQRGFGNGHENSVSQPEFDNANVGKAARQQSLSDYQRRRNRQRRRRIQRRRVPARMRRRRNQRRRPQRLRLRRRPNRIRQQVLVRRRRTRAGGRPSGSGSSIPLPNIPLPNFIRLPAKK